MVLAAYGQQVSESELQAQARREQRGVHIGELERLARLHDLMAEIQETMIHDLRRLIQEGKLPIASIDFARCHATLDRTRPRGTITAKGACHAATRSLSATGRKTPFLG
jgi:hypothetical protein